MSPVQQAVHSAEFIFLPKCQAHFHPLIISGQQNVKEMVYATMQLNVLPASQHSMRWSRANVSQFIVAENILCTTLQHRTLTQPTATVKLAFI